MAFMAFVGPIGAAVCSAWMLFYLWVGYPWLLILGNLPIIVYGFLMPLGVRTRVGPTLLATVAALLLGLAVLSQLLFTGGMRSWISAWLLLVPYVAVMGGARSKWPYIMGAIALGSVAIAVVESTGNLPASYAPYPVAQPLLSWLCALFVLTLGIVHHHRSVQQAITQEQSVSATLKQEMDLHLETQVHLASTQKDLIESARMAGMAEVANGVLHNVGNGLNSVNVSVALLAEHANLGQVERLIKLADAVECPETPREVVGQYLRRVAQVATEQNALHKSEIRRLRQQVEHVNTVVQAQQHFARHGGLIADISVPDLLKETLLLVASRLTGVSLDVSEPPNVVLAADRHKTMLVLLNLINNAADAVESYPNPTIGIAITKLGHEVVFTVSDNGIGIPEDNLQAIFNHGFTTKPKGHGFGLHSSALAARELSGRLEVASAGIGHGATFNFTVPIDATSSVPPKDIPVEASAA